MSFKIEIINNAVVVTDTVLAKVVAEFPSRDVYFDTQELEATPSIIKLYDTNGVNEQSSGIWQALLSLCVDVSLVPFTEATFRDFARVSLGFNAASGGGGTLAETLVLGKTSGGNDIVMSLQDVLRSIGGGNQLDFSSGDVDTDFFLGNDPIGYTGASLSWFAGAGAYFGYDNVYLHIRPNSAAGGYTGSMAIVIAQNGANTIRTSNNAIQPNVALGHGGGTFAGGISNTVIAGGVNIAATVSNALYANKLILQAAVGAADAIIDPSLLTVTRTAQIQDKDGVLAYLSDTIKPIDRAFGSDTIPYLISNATTYEALSQWEFQGTDITGILTNGTMLFTNTGAVTSSVRLFDVTNVETICELTAISPLMSGVFESRNFGTISNLPTGKAIFELQILVSAIGNNATWVASILID